MEGALRRTLNLAKPDDVYNALVDAHKGLSDEECRAFDARPRDPNYSCRWTELIQHPVFHRVSEMIEMILRSTDWKEPTLISRNRIESFATWLSAARRPSLTWRMNYAPH